MSRIERLEIKWTTSRSRDAYGYDICTLCCNGGKWSTCGGGYDMLGTVLGDYFTNVRQDALRALVEANKDKLAPYVNTTNQLEGFYGLFIREDGSVYLDGWCGQSSMQRIIEACGYELDCSVNNRGTVTTFYLQKRDGA